MKNEFWDIAKMVILVFAIMWIITFLSGCASTSHVSCYQSTSESPIYQGEVVRVINKNQMLESNGNLKTINGMCLHDNPGFWNRMTFGLFDTLERGQ